MMHTTPNLTEKELMQDALTSEKQVISAYSTGITETSCQNLRNVLVDNFIKTQDVQYKVFDAMRQKGWYPTKDAPDADVQEIKNQSNQLSQELK